MAAGRSVKFRQVPSSSVKFQGQPSQNAAHSFFSSNPSPHLIGRTGDTAVREAHMPSTAPSQHVAISSLTRRVLRCASEVISMQSASIDGNQHAPRIYALKSCAARGERFPIVHTQWRDQFEASRVAVSRNQSQSVAISMKQPQSRNQSQSVAHRTCTRESDSQ